MATSSKPVTGSEKVIAMDNGPVTGAFGIAADGHCRGRGVRLHAVQLRPVASEQCLQRISFRRVDRQPVFQLDGDDLGREPSAVSGRHPLGGVPVTLLRPVHGRVRDREVVEISSSLPSSRETPSEPFGRPSFRPEDLARARPSRVRSEIRRFLELGVSKTAIAKLTGVSRTALYSFMNTRGLRPG